MACDRRWWLPWIRAFAADAPCQARLGRSWHELKAAWKMGSWCLCVRLDFWWTRNGKHTKNYRKSPSLIGKSSISMGQFCYVKLPEGILSGRNHWNILKHIETMKTPLLHFQQILSHPACFSGIRTLANEAIENTPAIWQWPKKSCH